jgi:hypothetical protein
MSDIVGVDFGDSHVTASLVRGKRNGRFTVSHVGWAPYNSSAPEKDIVAAVRTLWRTFRMPTRLVCASLRSASMAIRYFRVPAMREDELTAALALQAEESLQVPRNGLVVDWHINRGGMLREGEESAGRFIEGVLAAAPLKDVQRMLRILFAAGLDPVILDVRSMAVANLYGVLGGEGADEPARCLINMAPHSADVIMMTPKGGVYTHTVFCRASAWAEAPDFLCENLRDVMKYTEFKLEWERVEGIVLTGEVPGGNFAAKIESGVGLPVKLWDALGALGGRADRVVDVLRENPGLGVMLTPSLGLSLRRG